jgi:hypothetical protein
MTERAQRLLTEFLGECWHDWPNEEPGRILYLFCPKCGDESWSDAEDKRLDFTDWRVVGSLVEKVQRKLYFQLSSVGASKNCWKVEIGHARPYHWAVYNQATPQAAICAAILVYLEDKP